MGLSAVTSQQEQIAAATSAILQSIGEDPTRDGLLRTPGRYARAMLHFTRGYDIVLENIVNDALFDVNHNELVLVKDIEIFSLCEHHLVPFMGKVCAPSSAATR